MNFPKSLTATLLLFSYFTLLTAQAPILQSIIPLTDNAESKPDLITTSDGNFLAAYIRLRDDGSSLLEVKKFDKNGSFIWSNNYEQGLVNGNGDILFYHNDPVLLTEIESGYVIAFRDDYGFGGNEIIKINKTNGDLIVFNSIIGIIDLLPIEDELFLLRPASAKGYSLIKLNGNLNVISETIFSDLFDNPNLDIVTMVKLTNNRIVLLGRIQNQSGCYVDIEGAVYDVDIIHAQLDNNLNIIYQKSIEFDTHEWLLRQTSIGHLDGVSLIASNNGSYQIVLKGNASNDLPCSTSAPEEFSIFKFNANGEPDQTWPAFVGRQDKFGLFDDEGFMWFDNFTNMASFSSFNSLMEININGSKGWQTEFIGDGGVGFGSKTIRATSSTSGTYVTLQDNFVYPGPVDVGIDIAILKAQNVTNGDLIVSDIQATPDSAPTGSQISVSGRVRNIGTETSGTNTLKIFASSDTSFDSDDIEIFSSTNSAIASGGSANFSSWITIPDNLPSGQNNLIFIADFNNDVVESNESNNATVRGISLSTGINCTDNLENNNSINNAFDIGPLTSYSAELCLTPGDNDWFTFSYLGEPFYFRVDGFRDNVEGSYQLTVDLNQNQLIIETNEISGKTDTKILLIDTDQSTSLAENDDKSSAASQGWPFSKITYQLDVQIVNNLVIDQLNLDQNMVQAGDNIAANLTIRNQGNDTSPALSLKYYLSSDNTFSSDDVELSEQMITTIPPNGILPLNATLSIPNSTESGEHFVLAIVDSENILQENNESDNIVFEEITINSQTYIINSSTLPSNAGFVSGTGTYTQGQDIILTATPFNGFSFINWTTSTGNVLSTDPNLNIQVNSDLSLQANFEQVLYNINANVIPSNSGSIEGTGAYSLGDMVNLIATPAANFNFINWTNSSGVVIGTDINLSFEVTQNTIINANFEQAVFNISVISSNPVQGIVSGEGNYLSGIEAKVNATPTSGFNFLNWTENNIIVSTSSEYLFIVDKNRELIANFEMTSSTQEINKDNIIIYPNPSNQEINISEIPFERYSISIIDSKGKLILSAVDQNVININDLTSGFFILSIIDKKSNTVIRKKITKY